MSPALAGGFFTTDPPGKPQGSFTECLNQALLQVLETLHVAVLGSSHASCRKQAVKKNRSINNK